MAIAIEERDVEESFVRAAGPGGQYVNKVATAVQLRFDIRTLAIAARRCAGTPGETGGPQADAGSVLIIHRPALSAQERNRQDALERLVALLRLAPLVHAVELSYLAPGELDGIRVRPRRLTGVSAHCRLGFLDGLSPLRPLPHIHVLIPRLLLALDYDLRNGLAGMSTTESRPNILIFMVDQLSGTKARLALGLPSPDVSPTRAHSVAD